MSDDLKISVTIPTHNPNPDYLRQAIESVLNGGFDSEIMELLVIDNCSDKVNVLEICEINSNVQYIRNPTNLGMTGNWNRCIELAQGEYIHILHDDDFVLDGFYTNALKIIDNLKPNVILGSTYYIKDGTTWLSQYPVEWRYNDFLGVERFLQFRKQYIQCVSIVASKDCYLDTGLFNSSYYPIQDWEMWCRIFDKQTNIYLSEHIKCAYRIHENNISNDIFNKSLTMLRIIYLSFLFSFKSLNSNYRNSWKFILHCANWINKKFNNDLGIGLKFVFFVLNLTELLRLRVMLKRGSM